MDGFLDQLSGLPLLLTQDNHLHLFSSAKPKFLTFHDLLPGSPQVFLHEDVCGQIFTALNVSKSPFLKPLDVEGFVVNLPQTLPERYYGNEAPVEWCPSQEGLPNHKWLSRVWNFLGLQTQHILSNEEINEESKIEKVNSYLQPLTNSRSVKCLKEADRRKLTKLPFYRATYAGYIRLVGHLDVKVLPVDTPREEFKLLENQVDTVFLECWQRLSNIFKFIRLVSLSAFDLYCAYILPNLNIFSEKAREVHLGYVLNIVSTGSFQ